jgi:tetratricopeptide (TPR) repeat protein
MKRLILAVTGLGALVVMGFYMNRATTPAVSTAETGVELTPEQPVEQPQAAEAVPAKQPRQNPATTLAHTAGSAVGRESGRVEPASFTSADFRPVLDQAVETLVSAQASFEQKQAVWKRLKETGKLDQAITELEQRATNDPRTAENTVALGVAFLKKAGLVEDAREKATLAMKADQTLEAALNLDPSNWEARYTKAVGMSYWPSELNKGQEVIEQFQILIQQQEVQPAKPEFGRSYLWLGDQYQKGGQAEYAAQVWQRGAALFPENEELKGRLSFTSSRPQ